MRHHFEVITEAGEGMKLKTDTLARIAVKAVQKAIDAHLRGRGPVDVRMQLIVHRAAKRRGAADGSRTRV